MKILCDHVGEKGVKKSRPFLTTAHALAVRKEFPGIYFYTCSWMVCPFTEAREGAGRRAGSLGSHLPFIHFSHVMTCHSDASKSFIVLKSGC